MNKLYITIYLQANLRTLLKFLEFYPEYSNNDLYLSGFSYAGIYVPTLANDILKHNRQHP